MACDIVRLEELMACEFKFGFVLGKMLTFLGKVVNFQNTSLFC